MYISFAFAMNSAVLHLSIVSSSPNFTRHYGFDKHIRGSVVHKKVVLPDYKAIYINDVAEKF